MSVCVAKVRVLVFLSILGLLSAASPVSAQQSQAEKYRDSPDLKLATVAVRYLPELELLVFEQKVRGTAGKTKPTPAGQLNGAPVLAYVFRTTLKATDVGFGEAEGIVALVVTVHPDFDDTPLWDENGDGVYDNDGNTYHTHWVVLEENQRAPADLAVKAWQKGEKAPPTHPGMPLYLDSPGFSVVLQQETLRVLVPAGRIGGRTDFRFDGVTAYLQVSQEPNAPMLGVHAIYSTVTGEGVAAFEVQKP